jgi:hypothetical protein
MKDTPCLLDQDAVAATNAFACAAGRKPPTRRRDTTGNTSSVFAIAP